MAYKRMGNLNLVTKKYVNAMEGQAMYSISKSRFMEMAKSAGAIYKVGKSALVNTEIFEEYLEQYREPSKPLPKHFVDKAKMMKYNESRKTHD